MTTEVTAPISDNTIISTLVASHGSISLAAERLHISTTALVERLPSLPYATLVAGIKATRLLQAFDTFTVMKDVLINTLPDLSPDRRAKLFIEFADRFQTMLEPPVQGASAQNNIQVNFGSPEQLEDARASLASRLITLTHVSSTPGAESLSEPSPPGSDNLSLLTDDGASLQSAIRLGALGKTRAARASDAVDSVGDHHG